MKALRHISDYLTLAAKSGSKALERACATGTYSRPIQVTLGETHGWRLTVTSQSGGKWLIWIELDEVNRRYLTESRRIK